ncbi:MAG: glycosyl hydrolase family 28-related protein [Pseudomonadota bacterium]|jgi:hypothetical protein|nr:glycosyl hydrolase family 28-related protein [Pseudomonadota bacterium]
MNKAVTEGFVLTPPAFDQGLANWSRGDGTSGTATYDGDPNAAFVAADQDFAGCLEVLKNEDTQKIRAFADMPFEPGCYVEVRARVKALSGNLPSVRIAAWAGNGSGAVTGIPLTGPSVALAEYGTVYEVRAIIGSGNRSGVDMVWGTAPTLAHVGIDLTGTNGGLIRIDDIEVEDVTSYFLRGMMDWVDVRDYGAIGDGVTDDSAAFELADSVANGRDVLVPSGVFHLADHVTFESKVRFVGTVTMPADKRLALTRNFDLPSYIDAFGSELEGFERALATLFNFSDHESLDMKGRIVELDRPVDVQAAVGNKDTYAIRRVIRNGQLYANPSTNWDPDVVTSQATYSTSNKTTLTNVANIANIPDGALVTGLGVGREVYVTSRNVGAGTLTLSAPLFDAAGTQVYTFTRFKYLLDLSGFASLDRFVLSNIDFQCNGEASGVMIAPSGGIMHFRDCFFTKPANRGITSTGKGCQGMLVDRCQFLSNEQPLRAQDRETIAMNVNANDTKIRDNRVVRFAHFGVWGGSGHMFMGNHWFQGDNETDGIRQAGIVLTDPNCKTTITANYIDNSFVEWTNEHDEAPEQNNEFSFGALTVTGNIFTVNNVAPWFRWFVIKPVGAGHFIQGLNISGNTFKAINGSIDRVEYVDTTYADLDMGRTRNLIMEGNTFNGVSQFVSNPCMLQLDQNSTAGAWTKDFAGYFPFNGRARNVVAVTAEGEITNNSGNRVTAMPYVRVEQGSAKTEVDVVWPEACEGRVQVTARMDNAT